MKKVILVLSSIFIFTGCVSFSDEVADEIKESQTSSFIREPSQKKTNEIDYTWSLVDKRTNEVVALVSLYDFGFVKGGGLKQEKLELFVSELAAKIDQPLINPTITRNGEIKAGQKRVVLNENELIEKLLTLHYYNKYLFLPIYEEEPKVTVEQLSDIKNSLISTFSTRFNSSVQGRSMNIKRSSEAIDHFVLGPEEVFSFNKVVGQRTKEKGYQEAKEIVNKKFIMGIGGGICQTSSTLFNAIDLAGLEIVERYTHSREIGYVKTGRDATVSWGGPDFKFKNPYKVPILISAKTNIQQGTIIVEVYSSEEPKKIIAKNQ